ncbi:hypothetical protein RSOLAG22IIIB_04304 [Rhizoctonia solani]|uniref:Uncharacterized protein n=1 Tax=Rhizoctonia solani TaxID=456999 RepID=A0A0K6FX64_9AGAM|nr:unnamed protein product [Rhizoctonia solani]CUA70708.1 hypothetical protein RSOLAG22IIIB_04304 [Rhizoctonia solani]
MFTGALLWIAAATAMPLGVCEIEGCSFSDGGGNAHALIRRLVVERQDSDSGLSSPSGPALGVILGGVFGALGGLAILGILFYAWWSIRRMRSRYETEDGGGSSSGPSSSTSRGSSSKSKKKRPKDGPKWQDPWLAPAPRSPRPLTPIQFHASASIDVAKIPGPQDDRGSDSSAIPLKAIYPSDDKQ